MNQFLEKTFQEFLDRIPKGGGLFIRPGDNLASAKHISPKDEAEGFTLEEFYELLECDTIEVARCQSTRLDGWILVIDEEGKFTGKLPNSAATACYNNPSDFIVGNAILMRSEDMK